jgi:hypothetical protein
MTVLVLAEAGFTLPPPAEMDALVMAGVLDILRARSIARAQMIREATARG